MRKKASIHKGNSIYFRRIQDGEHGRRTMDCGKEAVTLLEEKTTGEGIYYH